MYKKIIFVCLIVSLMVFTYWDYSKSQIKWSKKVSFTTINDSWGTWKNNYSELNPKINYETFLKAIEFGKYRLLSINEFLTFNVENQRLNKYKNAKKPEEFYPNWDRPRGQDDIDSVNFLISTIDFVSPIIIASINMNDNEKLIKLDGVHRLIAAAIKGSKIKILLINLN